MQDRCSCISPSVTKVADVANLLAPRWATELGPEVSFSDALTSGPVRLRVERDIDLQSRPVDAPDLAVGHGTALWLQKGADLQGRGSRTLTDPGVAAVSRLLLTRGLSAGHRLRVVGDAEVAGRAWNVQAQADRDPASP